MADPLLVEYADGVATLTLNRPEAYNSLDVALKEALRDALAQVSADKDVRAVLLTGSGKAFCAGQDLREHAATLASGSANPLQTVHEHYNPIAQRLASLPKPVIAAVNGSAAGAGASLALLADFRVGGPKTSMLMAFAKVGLAADTGASWILPRMVGHAKATELLLLAEPVGAQELLSLGLLTKLVEDDADVLPVARELAVRLAQGPTTAYGAIKRQLSIATASGLADSLAVEAEAQAICGRTEDHRASTAAFVAKEKPVFTGR
ncbi:enoyl-CoA hydratase-related protein [Longispora albida]|uniref:enoyl-CoA hydratase-related protein n=1 Tax=Longispora albida TaxID=203523 RepID=UPI000362A7AD|nr:enoyl-CoA hydratase-related protein [Longispora albida]